MLLLNYLLLFQMPECMFAYVVSSNLNHSITPELSWDITGILQGVMASLKSVD